jgi:hypothetical protein
MPRTVSLRTDTKIVLAFTLKIIFKTSLMTIEILLMKKYASELNGLEMKFPNGNQE